MSVAPANSQPVQLAPDDERGARAAHVRAHVRLGEHVRHVGVRLRQGERAFLSSLTHSSLTSGTDGKQLCCRFRPVLAELRPALARRKSCDSGPVQETPYRHPKPALSEPKVPQKASQQPCSHRSSRSLSLTCHTSMKKLRIVIGLGTATENGMMDKSKTPRHDCRSCRYLTLRRGVLDLSIIQ